MLLGINPQAPAGLRTIRVNINASVNDFNLFVAAGSPKGRVRVIATVAPGVIIGSTSTGSYAFDTGTGWHPGAKRKLVNRGHVNGKGGAGGQGGDGPTEGSGGGGGAGGPAINAQHPITVDNTAGQINGGGGGGGGGGADLTGTGGKGDPFVSYGGGGGGGGRGTANSTLGTGGAGDVPGNNGGSGSDSGAAVGGWGNAVAGDGATGGSFGAAGGTGNAAAGGAGGGSGGAAGTAVNGDSKVTYIALGTINGARVG